MNQLNRDTERAPWFNDEAERIYLAARTSQIALHESLVEGFISGDHLDIRITEKSFRLLREMNKFGFYQLSPNLWSRLLSKIIDLGDGDLFPDPKGLFAFGVEVLRIPQDLKSNSEPFFKAMDDVLVRTYNSPHPHRLLAILRGYWDFPDSDSGHPSYYVFKNLALQLHALHQDQATEILLLSLVSAGLSHAEEFEKWLSRGGGYHNHYRVNSGLLHAAQGVDDFLALNVPRSEITANLNLPQLSQILRAMLYDGPSGRRILGPSVTAAEAYHLNGATRTETYNVYDVVRSYIIGQTQNMPDVILRALTAKPIR